MFDVRPHPQITVIVDAHVTSTPHRTVRGRSDKLYLIKLLRSQGMPECKLHVIFVALIISRISMPCLLGVASLIVNKLTGLMLSFGKLDDLGSAALHVYVTYHNTSEWLTANYLIAFKVLPTASHIYFH